MIVGRKYLRVNNSVFIYTCEVKTKTGYLVSYINLENTFCEAFVKNEAAKDFYLEYTEPRKANIVVYRYPNGSNPEKLYTTIKVETEKETRAAFKIGGLEVVDYFEWTEPSK